MTESSQPTTSESTVTPGYHLHLYIFLILLRICLSISTGYVHPDEYFQSGSELFFGCLGTINDETQSETSLRHHEIGDRPFETIGGSFSNLTTTWEFEKENAIRSIVPPTIITLWPLRVFYEIKKLISPHMYNEMPWNRSLHGWEIWIVPRVFLSLLSLLIADFCIISIMRVISRSRQQPSAETLIPIEVLVFASSWPTLVFLNRPFSNTLETLCLSLCFFVMVHDVTKATTKHHWRNCMIMGCICSLGVFTRFTFAIYAFPVVLMMVHHHSRKAITRWDSSGSSNATITKTMSRYIGIFLQSGLVILSSFICTSLLFIKVDGDFYASLQDQNDKVYTRFFTPFNALRYNSKISNLADHGLHPRLTHALVNMHMLYGPLAIFFYMGIFRGRQHVAFKNDTFEKHEYKSILKGAYGSIIFGLGILSCAPHQEPRFLLPILVPICILHGSEIVRFRMKRTMIVFWVVFNAVLALFFGGLHQGGIIPSILAMEDTHTSTPEAILFYHTYMPQSFLMTKPYAETDEICPTDNHEDSCSSDLELSTYCNTVPIIDLKDTTMELLLNKLNTVLMCERDNKGDKFVVLVAPRVALTPTGRATSHQMQLSDTVMAKEVRSFPNVSTEDMPTWNGSMKRYIMDMKISLYDIRCS